MTVFLPPGYSLTWKEANGPWLDAWPSTKIPNLTGAQRHTLTGLKCGTKYSLRITATNKVGTSQPAYLDVSTLGGGEKLYLFHVYIGFSTVPS